MLKKYLLQLKTYHRRAWREQKGQSLIIFVFAILGLIAMMGLALDLGLVYIERVRVSRTTDAAALASVVELPFEEEAIHRAIEYIELNGYRPGVDTEIKVRGCIVVGNDLKNVNETGVLSGGDKMTPQPPANRFSEGYSYPGTLTPPPEDKIATFVIDTLAYQPAFDTSNPPDGTIDTKNEEACNGTMANPGTALFGTANKLRVSGEVKVRMNFMQFFGFSEVPVSDEAVGENLTNLDVMVVFDVSGSMDFETNCFGCWTEDPAKSADIMNNPFPSNGDVHPLNYNVPAGTNANPFWGAGSPAGGPYDLTNAGHTVCQGPYASPAINGHKYVVLEAELYSENRAGPDLLPWQFEKRKAGQSFWVLQRQGVGSNKAHMRAHSFVTYSQFNLADFPQVQGGAYNSECFNLDGSLSGECWKVTASSLGQTAPSTPPYLDYDFTVTWDSEPDSNTNIWVRAIGGSARSRQWSGQTETLVPPAANWQKVLYFQVNTGGSLGLIGGGELVNIGSQGSNLRALLSSDEDKWRWVKLNNSGLDLANGQHTLRIYQGSSAFNLDKIIITNDPSGSFGNVRKCFFGSCPGTPPVDPLGYGPEGPPATAGSANREACNMCNPMYGQNITDGPNQCSCKVNPADNVPNDSDGISLGSGANCTGVIEPTDMQSDDLFHDLDPVRSAQEAVKNFAARLDPKFDQIGVIAFSDGVTGRVKLQCLRYEPAHGGTPADCYDPTTDPISYTRVIQAIEDFTPGGNTDISEGMREALKELGLTIGSPTILHSCTGAANADNNQACDRQGAARRVLIVMTDGAPNLQVSGCSTQVPWRGLVGTNDAAYNCSMYFAREAAARNVTVYTIGIGAGVNKYLLTAMAEGKVDLPDPTKPCSATNSNGHPCGDNGEYFNPQGGKFFFAPKPSDLEAIFDEILESTVVRIVG